MKETPMPSKIPPLLPTGIKYEHEFVDFVTSEQKRPPGSINAEDVIAVGFYSSETPSKGGIKISEDHFRASVMNS
jgi:hypothetical protein